ncbi:MAG: YaaA family protein [Candidatus Saccharibacteria bacterium]
MIVIIHSSKTMRNRYSPSNSQTPVFDDDARKMQLALSAKSISEIQTIMHVSKPLAVKTQQLIEDWLNSNPHLSPAMDSFVGDIYSGLRSDDFSEKDRTYANQHLRLLSGLYGILKPLDSIAPYRFEMGYRLPFAPQSTMYDYWGDRIAQTLPAHEIIVNASSHEYIKVIEPFIDASRLITPTFLSNHPKTNTPTFVAVHAKIARGAFARWIVLDRIESVSRFPEFSDLGYVYSEEMSSPNSPVYIAKEFKGLGLSQRLKG